MYYNIVMYIIHIYIYIYICISISLSLYIYIYIYISITIIMHFRARGAADLRTKITDFRGFDSSRILILRGGILMSIGNSPEMLSQQILVGIILIGRLGVRSVLIISVRKISNRGSRVPYSNTKNHALSHGKSSIFLRKCMHARTHSPGIWKKNINMNF